MTPKAEQAFADYVALGAGRSLAKLAGHYCSTESPPTRHLDTLKEWSSKFGWQDRLREIPAQQIAEATETRAAIYLRVIREYDRRTRDEMIAAFKLFDLHALHDRVKFPDPQRQIIEGNPEAPIAFTFIRDAAESA